jgi:hypothetical protein
MKKLLLAAGLGLSISFASYAQQKFEAKRESIKTRNLNQLFVNFPESTDDALWKVTMVEFTLKNLSKFTKDTVLVFKYKIVKKEPASSIGKGNINAAPKEGKNLEFYLASSTLGDDYEEAVRNNVKPQYEANKKKVLIPKDPTALKGMIDKIVIW